MRRLIVWYARYTNTLALILAFLVVLFGVIAHMSVRDRIAAEKVHVKLDYEAQLFKFLLLERDCGCHERIQSEVGSKVIPKR